MPRTAPRVGVLHCTATGAVVLGILFLLLWVTEAVADPQASAGMLVLLTQQALRTPAHLGRGLAEAILVGAVTGTLIALSYNLFRILGRPSPDRS